MVLNIDPVEHGKSTFLYYCEIMDFLLTTRRHQLIIILVN